MPPEVFKRDQNFVPVIGLITNDSAEDVVMGRADPVTLRMLVDSTISGTITGTVAATQSGTWNVGSNITGIANGRKTVTSAGTAEALAGSTSCKHVDITAETDNTGIVVVGGSGVIAALGTRQGTPLLAGDTYSIDIDNLADLFLDVTVSGDGVTFSYYT